MLGSHIANLQSGDENGSEDNKQLTNYRDEVESIQA